MCVCVCVQSLTNCQEKNCSDLFICYGSHNKLCIVRGIKIPFGYLRVLSRPSVAQLVPRSGFHESEIKALAGLGCSLEALGVNAFPSSLRLVGEFSSMWL